MNCFLLKLNKRSHIVFVLVPTLTQDPHMGEWHYNEVAVHNGRSPINHKSGTGQRKSGDPLSHITNYQTDRSSKLTNLQLSEWYNVSVLRPMPDGLLRSGVVVVEP